MIGAMGIGPAKKVDATGCGKGYLEAFRRLEFFFSAVTLLISADSRKLLLISNTDSLNR